MIASLVGALVYVWSVVRGAWLAVTAEASRLWHLIKDPRAVRVTFFIVYLLILQSGLQAVFDPPTSIAVAFGPVITAVWAWLLTVGGLVGAGSVLQGWNFVERVAVRAALSGAAIYAGVIATLHFTSEGQRLTQFGFVAAMATIFAWRLWEIRGNLIATTRE